MKKLLTLTLLAATLCYGNLKAQITTWSSNLPHDTTWQDTIHITGDFNVLNGVSLTVKPGTYIKALGNYRIVVLGNIDAIGTADSMITFTGSSIWKGIGLANIDSTTNDSTRFVYCDISKMQGIDNTHGGISIENFSKVKFDHCYIHDNTKVAVRCYNSNIKFINNNLTNNVASGTSDIGGVFYVWGGIYIFINNVFNQNSANVGGAIVSVGNYTETELIIVNNLFINNTAQLHSGAINTDEAFTIVNNTFVGNSSEKGGALRIDVSKTQPNGTQRLYNNIIWNNTATNSGNQIALNIEYALPSDTIFYEPDFYNNIIEGGIADFGYPYMTTAHFMGVYDNPVDIDPMFADSPNGGYRLRSNSPARDAGKADFTIDSIGTAYDLIGAQRIYNGTVDIGAYEWVPVAPAAVVSSMGTVNVDEDFEDFSIDLDTVFQYEYGNQWLDYLIYNFNHIDLVDTLLSNSILNIGSLENANGEDTVLILAYDGIGNYSLDSMFVLIAPVNDTPYFTSTPIYDTVSIAQEYTYNITAEDVDGDALSFTLTDNHGFLTLDDNGNGTALLHGIPTADTDSLVDIAINLSDGVILEPVTQEFIIEVLDSASSGIDYINNAIEWLSIQPNPSCGSFEVIIPAKTKDNAQLIISDMNGRLVKAEMIETTKQNGTYKLDATHLGKGIYTVRLNIGEKVMMSKVVIGR